MNEIINTMRDNLYKQVEEVIRSGETVDATVMSLYVQFKTLDMLDSIDSRLIDVENEVSKLNPMYK